MHPRRETDLFENASSDEPNNRAVAEPGDACGLCLTDERCGVGVHGRVYRPRICHTFSVTNGPWLTISEDDGGAVVNANRAWLRREWLGLTEAQRHAVVAISMEHGVLPEEVLLERLHAGHASGLRRRLCAGCSEPLPAGSRSNRVTCGDRCRQRVRRAGGLDMARLSAQRALRRSSTSA